MKFDAAKVNVISNMGHWKNGTLKTLLTRPRLFASDKQTPLQSLTPSISDLKIERLNLEWVDQPKVGKLLTKRIYILSIHSSTVASALKTLWLLGAIAELHCSRALLCTVFIERRQPSWVPSNSILIARVRFKRESSAEPDASFHFQLLF